MDKGEAIKGIRESVGLTRKEFSNLVDIPVRTLCDWENNKHSPPNYAIERLNIIASMYKQSKELEKKLGK